MNRSGLFGLLSFVVALAAVFTFEYAIAQTAVVTLCGNVGPYAHVHPCSQPRTALITTIPLRSLLQWSAMTAVRLGPGWTFVIWVALCVPSGVMLGLPDPSCRTVLRFTRSH